MQTRNQRAITITRRIIVGYIPTSTEKVVHKMGVSFQYAISDYEKSYYEVNFAESDNRDVFVDVNPRNKDGYEYKVVDKKELFVWSNK